MELLETRIQYRFRQPALLKEAMTHPSVRYVGGHRVPDNQRLEFLGDSVLQLVLSETLFQNLPGGDEGIMTKLRTRLASERALAKMARELDLGPFIVIGKGEEGTGGRDRDSTLADALEALLGAIYLDGAMEAARSFVLRMINQELQAMLERPVDVNPKGELQELLQSVSGVTPTYEIIHKEGPDHRKFYRVVVSCNGRPLGHGEGYSKQIAEIESAKAALNGNELKSLLREIGSATPGLSADV